MERDEDTRKLGDFDANTRLSNEDRLSFIGRLVGIVVGGIMCLGGVVLAVLGLSGSIEWLFEGGGLTSRLTNASPGVVFAALGTVILALYRPRPDSKQPNFMVRLLEPYATQSPGDFGCSVLFLAVVIIVAALIFTRC